MPVLSGIPPESQEKRSEPFYWAQNVGMIRGVGLGFAIVKEAVSLPDGEITCQSVVAEGTTFTVTLPLRPVEMVAQLIGSPFLSRLQSQPIKAAI